MKKDEQYLIWSIGIFIVLLLVLTLFVSDNYRAGMRAYDKCDSMTNASGATTYWFGHCLEDEIEYYETTEKCGLFGISCYEGSEPHTESYVNTKCWMANNGEPCWTQEGMTAQEKILFLLSSLFLGSTLFLKWSLNRTVLKEEKKGKK